MKTAGQFCLFENQSTGRTATPIHVHANGDEPIYMIEGELTAILNRQPRSLI